MTIDKLVMKQVHYDDMVELCRQTGIENKQLFVGYLRQPIYVTTNEHDEVKVTGNCCLDNKPCSYVAPMECDFCSKYRLFFKK